MGKSTLALHLNIENYITLDDINVYAMAKNDPKGFIEKPVIIDEAQRLPQLMITIKEYIDKERINGQFVLIGSASLQGFKDISDSLAGRIGIVELYPLNLKEKHGKKEELETSHYRGDIIETFVFDELIKANTSATNKAGIFYYGTTDRKEIDFVLEFGEKVVAIEVKASKSVSKDMFKHIYSLQKEMPNSFDKGIVFYGGDDFLKLDENMFAVPLGFLG